MSRIMNWRGKTLLILSLLGLIPTIASPEVHRNMQVLEDVLASELYQLAENGDVAGFIAAITSLPLEQKEVESVFRPVAQVQSPFFLVYMLRKFDIDVNCVDEYGQNAAFYLSDLNGDELFDRLRLINSLGLDLLHRDLRGETIVHSAARANDVEQIALVSLIQGMESLLELQDQDGQTPLMHAAWAGSIETVEFLVKAGANVKATDNKGRTAAEIVNQIDNRDPFNGPVLRPEEKTAVLKSLEGEGGPVGQQ